MEYYVAVKNEEDIYELITSNFQDIFLTEKGKAWKRVYSMLPFILERRV